MAHGEIYNVALLNTRHLDRQQWNCFAPESMIKMYHVVMSGFATPQKKNFRSAARNFTNKISDFLALLDATRERGGREEGKAASRLLATLTVFL
jgi:hypothetical protein